MSRWTLDDLSRLIDHTNLHPDATEADMAKLCDEAKRYHFKMVAINQTQSHFCAQQLAGTDIDTGAAIASYNRTLGRLGDVYPQYRESLHQTEVPAYIE